MLSIFSSSRGYTETTQTTLTPEQISAIKQAMESGDISATSESNLTPEQALAIKNAMESGQLSPATLNNLTPDQVSAIKQALKSGQVQPVQQGLDRLKNGQVSEETAEQLQQKAQKGTLSPEEIEAGKKILEKEKRKRLGYEEKASEFQEQETVKPEEEIIDISEKEQFQEGRKEKPTSKKEIPDQTELEIFGHNLFTQPPSTFAPIRSMPVSNDYVVGPGDEINILMWGRIDTTYNLVVDNEGVIQFPKIGPLTVAGQTFGEVKELIRQKAEAITGVNVNVSMGKLRAIQVFVLGEVKAPGVYTVSSLATVTNALLSSGGPTRLGSLRDVELKRNNKNISRLDFYDFLLKGNTAADTRLMPGDVIFVPQAGPMITVSGDVKRPAIYELREYFDLQEALDLAGGLSPRAFGQRIQIERAFENKAQIVQDISYDELASNEFPLRDGDQIRVLSILPYSENAVFLYGNVARPGEYAHAASQRVSDIIPDVKKSLLPDTYFPYALIKRYHKNRMNAELIPFDLGRVLLDRDPSQNKFLMPLDEIYVFHKKQFQDKHYAEISGKVRNPGQYFIDEMTIRDLIFTAGQLDRDASMGAGHLYRTDPSTKRMKIITFNVAGAMANNPDQNLTLQDLDKVIIHSIYDYHQKYTVSVTGTVNNPGEYPYAENMTVKDLIEVAGSIKDDAFSDEAELVRYDIIDGKTVETTILKFNVNKAIAGDPEHNLKLSPLDVITVKQVPEWNDKKKTITLTGEIVFPGTYQIRKDEALSAVLLRAGGFTGQAYLRGAVFTRESVREVQQKRIDEMTEKMESELLRLSSEEFMGALSPEDVQAQSQFLASQKAVLAKLKSSKASGRVTIRLEDIDEFTNSAFDLSIEDGDNLHIPSMPSTVNVIGAVYNPNAHIFDEKHPWMKNYLSRSGGPTKNAEDKDIYIIRADGTVISRSGGAFMGVSWNEDQKRWGFWNKFENTKLYPGDTILVPEKMIKPDFMKNMKDVTQILYQIAVTAGITITQVF
jgi:protein involved in polysaccharide export with SLBB domain